MNPTNLLDPKEFIFELPLYTPIKIDEKNSNEFIDLMRTKERIDAYNPLLKQETTYAIIKSPDYLMSLSNINEVRSYQGIKSFELTCVRTGQKIIIFIEVVAVEEDIQRFILTKVGQTPSIATLHISKLKQYDKVLPKEKLKEITKAVGLAANGVGIGSFVYLRRIFEYLIEEAHQIAQKDSQWNEDLYQKGRMVEKIELLRRHLPEFLVKNKSMYSILSKGIHELEEEECLKYFDPVKVGIELILDEKVEQFEKQKKIEDAHRRLQNITNQISK